MADGVEKQTYAGISQDIQSLLSSPERNYLVRYSGDQVKIEDLKGKKVGLYFSASWCGPCQRFTPKLVDVFKELSPKGDFEIVFVSDDEDDESFIKYFSKMPWLAIPFSDSNTRKSLNELFEVNGIPYLVILDETGKVSTDEGVDLIREYGVEAYPFTPEKVKEIKDQEEAARRNQSLTSILASESRNFVISADGKTVPIAELEGKTVGLFFAVFSFNPCVRFVQKLKEVYEKLKVEGEKFEIVMIPLGDGDEEEESLKQVFESLPWFSLPFKDRSCMKLIKYFDLSTVPTLVVIGPDGKTLHPNVADAIEEHGTLAYPFTPDKFSALAEIEKAKLENQTLESILVSGDQNFVIGKDGVKIPVSDLVGKNILLYFSAHWCPPCRAFTPKLIEEYHKIKSKNDDAFEVIFISSDRDKTSFDEYFSEMPWLALPYGDKRKESLNRLFKIRGIPSLVAIGPSGRTVTTKARDLVMMHGADAYPFTEERLKEIETEYEEMSKGWPENVKHALHEHQLVLTRSQMYSCDGCNEIGKVWAFKCEGCNFDLHPKCALKKDSNEIEDEMKDVKKDEGPGEGWKCDGDVCFKA